MSYRISIRANVRPDAAGELLDAIAPIAREAGLGFRSGVPGLLEGDLEPERLAGLLDRLSALASSAEAGPVIASTGVLDDLWVHVQRRSG